MVISIQRYSVIGKPHSRHTVSRAILELSAQSLLSLAEGVALCAEWSTDNSSGIKATFHTMLAVCPADTLACYSIVIY
jgi:hypothetical protein